MEPKFSIENWVRFDPLQNQQSQPQNHNLTRSKPAASANHGHEDDFDFGWNMPENHMCSADEIFFRGQLLPFRHSVSLPPGFMTHSRSGSLSVASSRSNSTRSHNSGTSGSGSSNTSGSEFRRYKPTIRNRNQFHWHPSPTPQIQTKTIPQTTSSKSKWSLLQLTFLKPQEIGLADLKNRSPRSQCSGSSSASVKDDNPKKTKQVLLFGGCKCATNAIETTVSSMVKPTALKEEETKSKEGNVGRRKRAVSRHRTSEWLKQLSIQESALQGTKKSNSHII